MGSLINRILNFLQRTNSIGALKTLMSFMYRVKGKHLREINYLKDSKTWEFNVNGTWFYSPGPGWVAHDGGLLSQFKDLLGHHYLPKSGDVVVDVGAGVGEDLPVLSKLVGTTGKVYAIEAHPVSFEVLKRCVSKNGFTNVGLLQKAVNDRDGEIFIEDTDNLTNNAIGSKGLRVDAFTFDSFVKQNSITRIDFIKVNIEGAERLLIQGMDASLPIIQNLAISCHDFRYEQESVEFFKTKQLVTDFLVKHGFKVITRVHDNPQIRDYVYASR